jgi:adenylate cyclase
MSYYLPSGVAERLSTSVVDMTAADQHVYGVCLSTDAEGYTSLSERMGPGELGAFLNRYYETIFRPIRKRGGIVSDVVGDSALAVWVAPEHDRERREAACAAALEIMGDLRGPSEFSSGAEVPTRIGLHAGDIMLGNIGAMDHYEYRPVGDIVNTATRIQGLNKHVGTGILASADVVDGVDGFLTREVGTFLLAGKSKPLPVCEIMCLLEDAVSDKVLLCDTFTAGLSAFRAGRWGEAHGKFRECMTLDPGDGPSRYYSALCERYGKEPPGGDWDGVIRLDRK